jgi:flagellar hook-basal body complex protein FliE
MNAIKPLDAIAFATPAVAGATPAVANGVSSFAEALGQALQRTDASQMNAERLARAYQTGDEKVSLEASMVALQEANVSLQFAVQVRNRVVSAYHDIMNMPV